MLRRQGSAATCLTLIGAALCVTQGCGKGGGRTALAQQPDSLPIFIGDSLPFAYPPSLYISLVQDNVTLRLHLDEFGRPVPESTRVEEHALHPAFDSSALEGASKLVFRPAYRHGAPIPYTILFPIKFRVPDGPPMPGDPPRAAK